MEYSENSEKREDYEEQLKVFDFSNHPLPLKGKNNIRIFYKNINGLEINSAVEAMINNKVQKQKHLFTQDVEEHTKIESFLKQTSNWNVDVSILAEPCIEWQDTIPRKTTQDMDKKYNCRGNWTLSTSECYSGSFVKPGGSLIYSTGCIVGRIVERRSDPWGYGRWT